MKVYGLFLTSNNQLYALCNTRELAQEELSYLENGKYYVQEITVRTKKDEDRVF